MIKLAFKSLKSFFIEKKTLVAFLIIFLFIGNLIFLFNTKDHLRKKENLKHQISFSVSNLANTEQWERILDSKYTNFIEITTDVSILTKTEYDYQGMLYTISSNLCDPFMKDIDLVSENMTAENPFILSNPGASCFPQLKLGDMVYVDGEQFTYSGTAILNFPCYIYGAVTKEDFFELFKEEKDRTFNVYAEYNIVISEKQLDTIIKELETIGIKADVDKDDGLKISAIIQCFFRRTVMFSFIISIILYGYYIDSRLRDYSVFRIIGISRLRLMLLYLMETVMMFTLSYVIAAAGWAAFAKYVLDKGMYYYGKICLTGYVVIFIAYMLVNIPYLIRLADKSTMNLYRKSRRIG